MNQLDANRKSLKALQAQGMLMLTDKAFPSLVATIAGGPIKGSWWGHPLGNQMFNAGGYLGDHADVLCTKFLSGKVTFIHRKWWDDFLSVVSRRRDWQEIGDAEQSLLALIKRRGQLRADEFPPTGGKGRKPGDVAKLLEERLLVHYDQIHADGGHHVKVLSSWAFWQEAHGYSPQPVPYRQALLRLEQHVSGLNELHGAKARLPWQ